jgi:hypothetical protein
MCKLRPGPQVTTAMEHNSHREKRLSHLSLRETEFDSIPMAETPY